MKVYFGTYTFHTDPAVDPNMPQSGQIIFQKSEPSDEGIHSAAKNISCNAQSEGHGHNAGAETGIEAQDATL